MRATVLTCLALAACAAHALPTRSPPTSRLGPTPQAERDVVSRVSAEPEDQVGHSALSSPVAPAVASRGVIDDHYDRGGWPHWIDADHDCQDTRTEALVAASEIPVTFVDGDRCEVARGRWRCPYTDAVITDPRELDVDHLVPLAEAHRSGGAHWSKQRRRQYANDLAERDHLVVVVARANRSKGSRTIAQWLPDEPGFRCQYVEAWVRIKRKWQLTIDAGEAEVADVFLKRCRAGDVPALAHERVPKKSAGACCRVCTTGQPCGDGCIAIDKSCRKPPGCACGAKP